MTMLAGSAGGGGLDWRAVLMDTTAVGPEPEYENSHADRDHWSLVYGSSPTSAV